MDEYGNRELVMKADDYFKIRIHAEEWFENDHETRAKALHTAQEAIFKLIFIDESYKTKPEVEKAVFEEAFERIKGRDPQLEYEKLFKRSEGYSSIRVTYDRVHAPEHVALGIVSTVAWQYLKPYLDRGGSVILHRVD
jgi:phosphoglycolate phosphatase-like HAD superfamily hydrolase